jgi:hypothetical protein
MTDSATRRDASGSEILKEEAAGPPLADSDDNRDLEDPEPSALAKTKTSQSIAETLPWYRELLFVALVCLAQLYTRESPNL